MQSLPAQFDSWTLLSTDITYESNKKRKSLHHHMFTLLKGPKVLLSTMIPFCSNDFLLLNQSSLVALYDKGPSTLLAYHATGLVSRNIVCCRQLLLTSKQTTHGSHAVHVLNMRHTKFACMPLLPRATCFMLELVVGSPPSLSHRSLTVDSINPRLASPHCSTLPPTHKHMHNMSFVRLIQTVYELACKLC